VEAPHSSTLNPGREVDTEVLIKPGTGAIRAIAVDRPYGNGYGQTTVDYAVNLKYDGTNGVQTGSSSKLFTLLTALKQGVPFGFNLPVTSPITLAGYYNCHGQPVPSFVNLYNAEQPSSKPALYTLYNGTTGSINVFYAELERKVGLCSVVKTAVSLGMTRGDGSSLLRPDRGAGDPYSADNVPSFTLGSVNVSPMNMAAAYATVASRGVYCHPIAIAKIVTATGVHLPVESAGCHRVLSTDVADAAAFILQGVINAPTGTATDRSIGRPAAAKTGTANDGYYAAFAGFTPSLAGYVSVFNPIDPTTGGKMLGYPHSCYRDSTGVWQCPGQMYGDMAPGATWQLTFLHASLGPPVPFVGVSPSSPFLQLGNGFTSPKPPAPPKQHKPGGGNGGGPPTPKPKPKSTG
jgi:membrane peptidoglycan carboxypeptidase